MTQTTVKRRDPSIPVNAWMSDRSDHKLGSVVPRDAALQGCAAVSGLYYHGQWAEGFNAEDSQRDIFNCGLDPHVRGSGRTVSALMLRKRGKLPYAEVRPVHLSITSSQFHPYLHPQRGASGHRFLSLDMDAFERQFTQRPSAVNPKFSRWEWSCESVGHKGPDATKS